MCEVDEILGLAALIDSCIRPVWAGQIQVPEASGCLVVKAFEDNFGQVQYLDLGCVENGLASCITQLTYRYEGGVLEGGEEVGLPCLRW